ncbi:hypothetical protein F5Y16DRAFT_362123 [Xylariaceae sp. FL0255]|nr:hypothetical protein F5Y16DRAFT_362123 [Xylariaceae sp. FL0255]
MTSLVAEFLVNPVIRQARRFSFTRYSFTSEPESPSLRLPHLYQQDDVISETDEERHDDQDSLPSRQSSRSSVQPIPAPHIVPNDCDHESEASFDSSSEMASTQEQAPRRPSLPEDDGMGTLRKRIRSIQSQKIGSSEKARLMHQLLSEGYTKAHTRAQVHSKELLPPSSPRPSERPISQTQGPLESFKFWQNALEETQDEDDLAATDKDREPTFVPLDKHTAGSFADFNDTASVDDRLLGCEHYRRNVKLQCSTCHRWYTCRFCHDKAEDHTLIRKDTKNMLCMFCGTTQRAGPTCVACEAPAARYYCDICKLWQDDPDRPCYHCNDCGICRIGRGIGKDFFHCKKCCACIAISQRDDHKCVERATDCDCPICGEYMFTSPQAVVFMRCGHTIHKTCFHEHMKTSYKCPICNKSLANMESQFRNLDLAIQAQPMPEEFQDARAIVLCHDCSAKSSTAYHWLGLKCGVCHSYNTAQLQVIGLAADSIENDLGGRSAQVSGLAPSDPSAISGLASSVEMDMRRPHSSGAFDAPIGQPGIDAHVPGRTARSVSPVLTPGHSLHASTIRGYFDLDEDEDDTDIIGFWSRVPRSITSNDDHDGDDLSSDEEVEDDGEGEESEDDDFELLGHR